MRAPIVWDSTYASTLGLAFDKSRNLWAVVDGVPVGSSLLDAVVRLTPHELKQLKKQPSQTPAVTITSASTFIYTVGCNFDPQGNLWVVDAGNDSIDELSKAQLDAGSGDITPATIITSPDLDYPQFVAFDSAGNAWISSLFNSEIAEFSASQLRAGSGSRSATVVLSDDGSGTSLSYPGEIAFDSEGNLWVPSASNTAVVVYSVVEYSKEQLRRSGNPAPKVKLSSAAFDGPSGEAFDSAGDLVLMNRLDGSIAKFTPQQQKASGTRVPFVFVTGNRQVGNLQITFGPGL